MDYDGANQQAVTHLGTISLSPRISPDGSRLAFTSLTNGGCQITMYSTRLDRTVSFPRSAAPISRPHGRPTEQKLAFSSSRSGDPEICIVGLQRRHLQRADQLPRSRRLPRLQSARPARRSPGSADAPVCRRSTSWMPTAPTPSASPTRVTRLAVMVSERPVPRLRLDSPLRPRRARRPGHLRDGDRQQAMGSADPRRRRATTFRPGRPTARHIVFQSSRTGS